MKTPNSGILTEFYDGLTAYDCIYNSQKTTIYNTLGSYTILTKEKAKYEYYRFALTKKYKYIPKIMDLIEDHRNGIFVIKREKLFPIIDTDKLARLQIVQECLKSQTLINDNLLREALHFYINHHGAKFDFGPHCFMQTKNKKIVVSDLFTGIK